MVTLGLSKSSRLLNSHDFQRVFQDAQFKVSHRYLLILARPNGLSYPRLGLVIAKKNIRFAVQRNRIKRRIRETFRLQQHTLPCLDAIVLARSQLDTLDNTAQTELLNKQWARLVKQFTKAQQQAAQQQ
ncbi:ribonuclease P protein component [Aurantivibrio plasticivorans]